MTGGKLKHAKAARSGRKLTPLAGRHNKPRQKRLPTMDDPALDEIETLAEDYADVRDRRIQLNKEEKPLKDGLLAQMKKHGKTTYHHGGVTVTVVPEGETVKVKIAKEPKE